MAFIRNNLTLNTAALVAGAPTVYSYYSTTDNVVAILADNYFRIVNNYPSSVAYSLSLRTGDRIICRDSSGFTFELTLSVTKAPQPGLLDTVLTRASTPCVLQTNLLLDYSGANTVYADFPPAGYLYAIQTNLCSTFTSGSLGLSVNRGSTAGANIGSVSYASNSTSAQQMTLTTATAQLMFNGNVLAVNDRIVYQLVNGVSGAANNLSMKVNAYFIPVVTL